MFVLFVCFSDILPGPPSAVSAVAQASPVGFVVSWREPADNSGLVKGYYIHYKLSADTIYQTVRSFNQTLSKNGQ